MRNVIVEFYALSLFVNPRVSQSHLQVASHIKFWNEFQYSRMKKKRTFIFQIENDSKIYADDVIPKVTLNYLYVGEIADNPMKNKVLYECDRRACHDKCNLECHHTTDVTHAKNFEYKDGTWVEV